MGRRRLDRPPLWWCDLPIIPGADPIPVYLCTDNHRPEFRRSAWGCYYRPDRTIWIWAGMPRSFYAQILLHEMAHGSVHRVLSLSPVVEERAVRAFTDNLCGPLISQGWSPPPLPEGWRALAVHARWVRFGKSQRDTREAKED